MLLEILSPNSKKSTKFKLLKGDLYLVKSIILPILHNTQSYKLPIFIPVVVWDKLAEVCGNNLTKGRRVLVEGRLQIRDYEKDGQKRRAADVVAQNIEFLDSKSPSSHTAASSSASANGNKSVMDGFGYEVEEEIPF